LSFRVRLHLVLQGQAAPACLACFILKAQPTGGPRQAVQRKDVVGLDLQDQPVLFDGFAETGTAGQGRCQFQAGRNERRLFVQQGPQTALGVFDCAAMNQEIGQVGPVVFAGAGFAAEGCDGVLLGMDGMVIATGCAETDRRHAPSYRGVGAACDVFGERLAASEGALAHLGHEARQVGIGVCCHGRQASP